MSTGIERPIELAPEKVQALLGARRGVLLLPMLPAPVVTLEAREALRGGLLELGYLADVFDDLTLITCGFDEGLLPSLRCPWGRGGDLLWVREPWAQVGRHWRYCSRDACKDDELVWLPAVRMPRAAARLVLKIDGVCIDADADGRAVWQLEVEVQRA